MMKFHSLVCYKNKRVSTIKSNIILVKKLEILIFCASSIILFFNLFDLSIIFHSSSDEILNNIHYKVLNIQVYFVHQNWKKMREILEACETGDCDRLKAALIKYEPKVNGRATMNEQFDNRESPLFVAVRNNSADCIKILLEYSDVNITAKNSFGENVLGIACRTPNNLQIIQIIVEHDTSILTENHINALFTVARLGTPEMAEYLIEKSKESIVDENLHKKYSLIISAIDESNLDMLIYLMFVVKATRPNKKTRKLLHRWVHARGALKQKLACFKIIYNYTYPEHCYRPTYPLKKVLRLIETSCMSETELLTFFFETVYNVDGNKENYQLILNIREIIGTGYDLILTQLHINYEKKFLNHQTNFAHVEILATIVFRTETTEFYKLFMNYWQATHHLHKEEYTKSLVQGIITGICYKDPGLSQFKWQFKKVVQFLNTIEFYSTINLILNIFGLIQVELIEDLLFIAAPYSDIEKEFEHWYHLENLSLYCPQIVPIHRINDPLVKMVQMEKINLKKLCREVVRHELYRKSKDFHNFQENILRLELPGNLIDYLQFIESV